MREFLERCRTQAERDGIDYTLATTDSPPERALRGVLLRRAATETRRLA
jgi:hypothetical protein